MTSRNQSWRRWSFLASHTQVAGGTHYRPLNQVTFLDPCQDPVVHLAVDPTNTASTKGTGLGNSPEPRSLYMVDLAKPVDLTTSLRRMILKPPLSIDMYPTGTKLRILSDLYSWLRK